MRLLPSFRFLFFTMFLAIVFSACENKASDDTTYYFIRHAEKDRSNPQERNPVLTEAGEARAQRWADYFKKVDLDAVYSTDYNRTKATAAPTAKAKNLEIQLYNPSTLNDSAFAKATLGKSVLVVGHSNTTPAFVNAVLNENKYQNMSDSDNSTLFIVTIKDGVAQSTTETID